MQDIPDYRYCPRNVIENIEKNEVFIRKLYLINKYASHWLTDRQYRVYILIMENYTNREIAEDMHITVYSVFKHKKRLAVRLKKKIEQSNHPLPYSV